MLALEQRTATFSPCRTWRYVLTRQWDDALPSLNVVGLNPSTADEQADDPTIRRCIGFARTWGYGGLVMTNLFAFRATDPYRMLGAPDPIGPENDMHLQQQARGAGLVLAAWGVYGKCHGRALQVLRFALNAVPLRCLGETKEGHPKHPLYIKGDTLPIAYAPLAVQGAV